MKKKMLRSCAPFSLGLLMFQPPLLLADPVEGLKGNHASTVDPTNNSFLSDLQKLKRIGENTATIPEASVAD